MVIIYNLLHNHSKISKLQKIATSENYSVYPFMIY